MKEYSTKTIFKDSWAQYVVFWKSLFKLNLVTLLITIAVFIPIVFFIGALFVLTLSSLHLLASILLCILFVGLMVISILAKIWMQYTAWKLVHGENISVREAVFSKETFSTTCRGLKIGLLYGLGTLVGLFLLIIPGVIFAIRHAFALFIYFEKNVPWKESFRQSRALTKGRGWWIFWKLLCIIAIPFFFGIFLGLFKGDGTVLGTVIQLLFTIAFVGFQFLYMLKLYEYLKKAAVKTDKEISEEAATELA